MSNPGFCDESEQEISDHHESESSDDIAEENEISTASGDLTLRLIATVCFCLLPSNNFSTFDFAVFAFCACIIHG